MAYFSNSSDGMVLDMQCSECILGDDPCPIAFAQMEYNYDQCGKGQKKLRDCLNLLVNEKSDCQLKPLLDAISSDGLKHKRAETAGQLRLGTV